VFKNVESMDVTYYDFFLKTCCGHACLSKFMFLCTVEAETFLHDQPQVGCDVGASGLSGSVGA
jgi:hypothetical protein